MRECEMFVCVCEKVEVISVLYSSPEERQASHTAQHHWTNRMDMQFDMDPATMNCSKNKNIIELIINMEIAWGN